MRIYKKILEDYNNSRKTRLHDDSKYNVTYIRLNFIIGLIRDHEREATKATPAEVIFADEAIIPLLLKSANQDVEMIDDLLKIYAKAKDKDKDKKILASVEELKESLNMTIRYLPKDEIKKFKSAYKDKNIESIPQDEDPSENAVGTGFFVDNKGHIITNYHVVKSSNNKSKILFKHDEISTNLIAHDEVLDLALLKAKVRNKHFIKFSNKSPKKAQSILVAGFPYGKFVSDDLKITSGIINSLKGIANNTSMLQIDATVNPGNSGGPIVDKVSGNLVGVATMKLSKDFTKAAFGQESENTNYGIKASQVKDFLEANNINISAKSKKIKISELEESTVFIFSKAMEMEKNIIAKPNIFGKPEMGKIYKGKVVKIMEFGAFVNFLGKHDGLVHITQLADKRVDKVSDVVKEGDEVSVKVIGFDRGKVKLSIKEAS